MASVLPRTPSAQPPGCAQTCNYRVAPSAPPVGATGRTRIAAARARSSMDRVLPSEGRGCRFDPCRARHMGPFRFAQTDLAQLATVFSLGHGSDLRRIAARNRRSGRHRRLLLRLYAAWSRQPLRRARRWFMGFHPACPGAVDARRRNHRSRCLWRFRRASAPRGIKPQALGSLRPNLRSIARGSLCRRHTVRRCCPPRRTVGHCAFSGPAARRRSRVACWGAP